MKAEFLHLASSVAEALANNDTNKPDSSEIIAAFRAHLAHSLQSNDPTITAILYRAMKKLPAIFQTNHDVTSSLKRLLGQCLMIEKGMASPNDIRCFGEVCEILSKQQ